MSLVCWRRGNLRWRGRMSAGGEGRGGGVIDVVNPFSTSTA
jgi:hypothetical protein